VGRHKSLNYLFYLAARQFALDQGAKEALIQEATAWSRKGPPPVSSISIRGSITCPPRPAPFPGDRNGPGPGVSRPDLSLKARRTTVAQLKEASGLWLANSLMGLMPVPQSTGRRCR